MIKNIEINDDMQERIDGVVEEVGDAIVEWLEKNTESNDVFGDWLDEGDGNDFISEQADSTTPIYNHHIDGLLYLYSPEVWDAYDGIGLERTSDYYKDAMAALCHYIEQQAREDAQDFWDDFTEKLKAFRDTLPETLTAEERKEEIRKFVLANDHKASKGA